MPPKRRPTSSPESKTPKKQKKSSSPKKSPSPKHSSDSNGMQYTYRLYSVRRKHYLGQPVEKENSAVVFKLKKPHYPRMDGCNYGDFQKGEKIYLKRVCSETEEEKILTKIDLSRSNLFEDIDWDIGDSESNDDVDHWAGDDSVYVEDHNSLPKFISKLASDEAVFESEAWSCDMKVDRETSRVYITSITVKLPKTF